MASRFAYMCSGCEKIIATSSRAIKFLIVIWKYLEQVGFEMLGAVTNKSAVFKEYLLAKYFCSTQELGYVQFETFNHCIYV
jgi:hypothetical protein